MEEKKDAKPGRKQLLFWGLVLVMGVLFFALNRLTPLIADDYSFQYGADGEKITSFAEVLLSEKQNYLTHTGRVLLHTFAQLFLLAGKNWFDLANTAVYLLLTLAVYAVAFPKGKNPVGYLAVCCALWLYIPVFGQTCLWLIGACNYLWGTVIVMLFCSIYAAAHDREKLLGWAAVPGMFVLGTLAGACNENTSGGGLLFAICMVVVFRLQHRRIFPWMISGILGSALGMAFLLLSPGNWQRNGSQVLAAQLESPFVRIASQFAYACVNYSQLWVPLCIAVLLLAWLYTHGLREKLIVPAALLLCSLATNFVMTFVGSYPARAMFGAAIFLLTACLRLGSLFVQACQPGVVLRTVAAVLCIGQCVLLYGMAAGDMMATQVVREDREASALQVVQEYPQGQRVLATPEIRPMTSYNAQYGLEDIFVDPDHWTNGIYAKEYGLDAIVMDSNAYRTWGQALMLILKGEYNNA